MLPRRTFASLLLLIWLLPGLALAAGKSRIVGMVVSPNGRPIKDATVTVTSEDIPGFEQVAVTGKTGSFNMKFTTGMAVYHFKVEKEGRRTFEADLDFEPEGTRRFEFTMHREDEEEEKAEDDEEHVDEVLETACFRARDVRHLTGIHDSYVYVQCERNEHFLLTMKGVCFGLQGSLNMSITGRSERVCSGTRAAVIFEDMNNAQVACVIRRVEEVEGETEATQIMEERTETDAD
jgi:hypothetical protein